MNSSMNLVMNDDTLAAVDRIDEIVPPGVTINHADNGWTTPALQPAGRPR